jgi:hypothetical protein
MRSFPQGLAQKGAWAPFFFVFLPTFPETGVKLG